MSTVRWKSTAKADLHEIYQHYLRAADIAAATRTLATIFRDLKKLADTPMLDRINPEFKGHNHRWYYVLNGNIEVYYQRLSPTAIRVVKLWSCKREDLQPGEVFRGEQSTPPQEQIEPVIPVISTVIDIKPEPAVTRVRKPAKAAKPEWWVITREDTKSYGPFSQAEAIELKAGLKYQSTLYQAATLREALELDVTLKRRIAQGKDHWPD